ncbi:MAG: helix-turn-helix transcriptional regulator [Phycisphaerales bacterium]|nr:helix-turn-helix transcriptional regulator [Phycisphaerales bacterium]
MTRQQIRTVITETMKKKNISDRDLSRKSDVSVQAIQRFLAARDEVSTPVIMRLLKALEIDTR